MAMIRHLKTAILCALSLTAAAPTVTAAEPPQLIVNIVVGSMQADALEKYAGRFDEGGLRKLLAEGAVFTDARYDCMQTLTPASLATLSTGAEPAIHGVVSDRWFDYTTGREVRIVDDGREVDFDLRDGKRGHSPRNLVAPTLADMIMRADSNSRIVSLALTPESAIVQTGRRGMCFWMDAERCRWTTSSYFNPVLQSWVKSYNAEDLHARFLTGQWSARFDKASYKNSRSLLLYHDNITEMKARTAKTDIDKISRTPMGNTVLFDFAKYAVKCLNMGNHGRTDMLNICLDTAAEIAGRYGPESIEYEDMVYRLDADIKEFLAYLGVHLKDKNSLLVVFTAAHGCSPAYDVDQHDHGRFNVPQFEVIMNAYLNALYGPGEWVLGYSDRSLYLNRNLIDEKRLSVVDVQNETAAFALRFRGVAHAASSAMMRSSYFADGYGHLMQNGFYPRRSGDVIVDLMPEWTEERDDYVAQSGSMFGYDTHVPLIICGSGIPAKQHGEEVKMTSVAPTLAQLAGLGRMPVSEAKPLNLQ